MWEIINSIAVWPLWSFLSLLLIVWITQKVIAARERKKRVDDTRLDLYMSIVSSIADLYEAAIFPPADSHEVLMLDKKMFETESKVSLFAGKNVFEAFLFYQCYIKAIVNNEETADNEKIKKLAREVIYAICCEIHGEQYSSCSLDQFFEDAEPSGKKS